MYREDFVFAPSGVITWRKSRKYLYQQVQVYGNCKTMHLSYL